MTCIGLKRNKGLLVSDDKSIHAVQFGFFFFQEQALKTFHISDDPKNYYVAEASEFGRLPLKGWISQFLSKTYLASVY